MFIVWVEDQAGVVRAMTKGTKLAAVRAYNRIERNHGPESKSYGWSESESADPWVRVAVGLKPFLELGENDD